MEGNRKYKDSFFTSLFGSPDKILELYNTINGTNYAADTKIEVVTLQNVFLAPWKNDLAFVLDGRFVVLVEHQSTLSENLPLRMLLYLAREYEQLIEAKNVYRHKRIMLPRPELIVLYNGTDPCPAEKMLRLSDAFLGEPYEDSKYLELEVKLLNINYDQSPQPVILEKSPTLQGYSYFIQLVREMTAAGMALDEALRKALEICIDEGILVDYLTRHGSEVINMLLKEWNLEDAKAVWREEWLEEGIEKGIEKGRAEGIEKGREEERKSLAASLLDILDDYTIAAKTKLPLEEVQRLRKAG